jgi:hypothetical protein
MTTPAPPTTIIENPISSRSPNRPPVRGRLDVLAGAETVVASTRVGFGVGVGVVVGVGDVDGRIGGSPTGVGVTVGVGVGVVGRDADGIGYGTGLDEEP